MPALQVKDCPHDVYEKLRECAAEENRSISQQALTILEDYLAMREALKTAQPNAFNGNRTIGRLGLNPIAESVAVSSASLSDMARLAIRMEDNVSTRQPANNYVSKREALFRELNELPPIPVTPTAPSAAAILAELRNEEAR